MDKISKNEFDKMKELDASVSKFTVLIDNRFKYILDCIDRTFEIKRDWVDYDNSSEYGDGSFCFIKYKDEIRYIGEWRSGCSADIMDKDDGLWGLETGFPTRWLWEDFEGELEAGKIKFEQKKEARKKKAQESAAKRKKKKQDLVASAKSKLTKEERKALRLKE